jgi:hypothetical protein
MNVIENRDQREYRVPIMLDRYLTMVVDHDITQP